MGLFSKNKGKRGEREAAKELQRILNVRAGRGMQFRGGQDSPDILIDIPEIHLECKRVERFNLYDAIEQATNDAGESKFRLFCIVETIKIGSLSLNSNTCQDWQELSLQKIANPNRDSTYDV
jgi:hypothetical protein